MDLEANLIIERNNWYSEQIFSEIRPSSYNNKEEKSCFYNKQHNELFGESFESEMLADH